MVSEQTRARTFSASGIGGDGAPSPLGRNGATVEHIGRAVALAGIVLPLLLIGGLKFTQYEVQGLVPLISGTPWLAWMYSLFGQDKTSYLLGVVEIFTALLLLASPWSPRAGVVGGTLGAFIFLVTSSMLLALPVWEASLGGFPALNGGGQFLIKDIALLGIALTILGRSLARMPGIARLEGLAREGGVAA